MYVYIYIYIHAHICLHIHRYTGKAACWPLVRPRVQPADLQCLKLQIAVAFPNPQNRALPGTELSQKTIRLLAFY